MTLPRPTIVIFDMDGTTVRHVNPRLLHVLEKMDDISYRVSRFVGWVFRRGAKGEIFFDEQQFVTRKKPKALVHRALHKVRRKPVEQIVEPCPGVYEVLNFLRAHGVPMALASNGLGKGYGHDILKKFELDQYFRATVFREDIHNSKPHPEPILLTLKNMGASLGADDVVWYIGDRHKDITAALAARAHLPCRVEPIAYGFNAAIAAVEKNLGPDHIIMSYYDMRYILEGLLGPAPNTGEPAPQKKRVEGGNPPQNAARKYAA